MERTGPDPLQCPRCSSSNTKFCYYNNYSLSQPRHFCKACKRYWTRGGTLRNVPVGGANRRSKKLKRHLPPPLSSAVTLKPETSSNPPIYNTPLGVNFELNFPFLETRVCSESPRLEALPRAHDGPGLGFSPYFRNGFEQNNMGDRGSLMSFARQQGSGFCCPTRYEDMEMVVGNNIGEIEQMMSSSSVGVWFDPSSSVPSLL